ncbi:MAG: glycoside hydrolase, partial [Blastocatellia bacterium]
MSALIIHGHFYQPPRENPWTGEVEREPSAVPYHDWNERIHSESYGPNAFARITGDVADYVVNNYTNISFNFGPTLLSWLEKAQPRTYQRILDADRESAVERDGHGNAIAQAYGHAILPLSNDRDRLTQIVWGIEDFRHRFKREPESLWLPEAACNDATLGTLIDFGLRYVILAPEQAKNVRAPGGQWKHVGASVDTTRPYRYSHPDGSGRSLAIFFYNGPLARAIAFERVLTSSRELVDRFEAAAKQGPLVNIATDGETYGHHFKFGDLCLAHALEVEAKQAGFWITNYGEFLDRNSPDWQVEIENGPKGEGSSWSCAHGVGRWSH